MIRTVVLIIAFSLCINAVWARDERSIKKLCDALVALAPDVDPGEADLVSVTTHTLSRSLAREYGVFWNADFQNLLIHLGVRQRGYCGHYTRDIGEHLKELRLKTLVLHWGAAYAGTPAENNCLVVTARNQPFEEGIIMDAWRHSGKLFWSALKEDTAYRRVVNPLQRSGDGRALNGRDNLLDGRPELSALAKPQRDRSCREFDKRGHQVCVVAPMSCSGLGDECVAIHLEPGRFRWTASRIKVLFQQLGEERLVHSSGPSKLSISIIPKRAC